MAVLPAVIGAGASIIGGLISSRGQSKANDTNLRIARENNIANANNVQAINDVNMRMQSDVNLSNQQMQLAANNTNIQLAREAQAENRYQLDRQYAFQQYNSDTAVTRAMQDYRNAGLNPMLAGMNPASAPSGGTTAAPVARVEASRNEASRSEAYRRESPEVRNEYEGVGQGIAASFSSAAQASQLGMMQAQIQNVNQSTAKLAAETKMVEAEIPYSASNARLKSFTIESGLQKLKTDIESVTKDIAIKDIDINTLKPLVAEYQRLTNKATAASIPAKEAEAELFKAIPEAKWLEIVRRVILGR